jgi:hypothetical protein
VSKLPETAKIAEDAIKKGMRKHWVFFWSNQEMLGLKKVYKRLTKVSLPTYVRSLTDKWRI